MQLFKNTEFLKSTEDLNSVFVKSIDVSKTKLLKSALLLNTASENFNLLYL